MMLTTTCDRGDRIQPVVQLTGERKAVKHHGLTIGMEITGVLRCGHRRRFVTTERQVRQWERERG